MPNRNCVMRPEVAIWKETLVNEKSAAFSELQRRHQYDTVKQYAIFLELTFIAKAKSG